MPLPLAAKGESFALSILRINLSASPFLFLQSGGIDEPSTLFLWGREGERGVWSRGQFHVAFDLLPRADTSPPNPNVISCWRNQNQANFSMASV